jgi:hypothetical protein
MSAVHHIFLIPWFALFFFNEALQAPRGTPTPPVLATAVLPEWVYAKPIRFPIRANKPIRYIGNV